MGTLSTWLENNANKRHFLFRINDLRSLFDKKLESAFKTQLSRAVKKGLLIRICKGVYLYPKAQPHDGLLLFRVANLLRANEFNYISIETTLSEQGIISQIPISRIFIVTSGRSNIINCNDYGTIEFVHTSRTPDEISQHLSYDNRCGMWRADVKLALSDMKRFRRNCDLIDWNIANEFI